MLRIAKLAFVGMSLLPLSLFAATVTKAAPATSSSPQTAPQQQTAQQSPRITFVIASQNATLQKADNGHYTLTLNGVPPYIRLYTQRPNRSATLANMQNFIASWGVGGNTSFQAVNPNAVVYAAQINGANNSANRFTVGILSNPSYNLARHQFSCSILPLRGQEFLFSKIDYENVLLVIN